MHRRGPAPDAGTGPMIRLRHSLVTDEVPAAKYLLDGLRAAPIGREPERAAAVWPINRNGNRVARTRLTPVGHADLKRRVATHRDRRSGIRDVLDVRLGVE